MEIFNNIHRYDITHTCCVVVDVDAKRASKYTESQGGCNAGDEMRKADGRRKHDEYNETFQIRFTWSWWFLGLCELGTQRDSRVAKTMSTLCTPCEPAYMVASSTSYTYTIFICWNILCTTRSVSRSLSRLLHRLRASSCTCLALNDTWAQNRRATVH